MLTEFQVRAASLPVGAARRVTGRCPLTGDAGWNAFQAGVLDEIPVDSHRRLVLHGRGRRDEVLAARRPGVGGERPCGGCPHRRSTNRTTFTFSRTHSIFISEAVGAEWDAAMTWDTEVLDVVADAIDSA